MIKRNTSKINTSAVDAPISAERLTAAKGIKLDAPITDLNSVKYSQNFELNNDGTYGLRKPLVFSNVIGKLNFYINKNVRVNLNLDGTIEIYEYGVKVSDSNILYKYTDINNVVHYDTRSIYTKPSGQASYVVKVFDNVDWFKASDSAIITGAVVDLKNGSKTLGINLYDSSIMNDTYAMSALRYITIYFDIDKNKYIIELITPEPNTLVSDSNNITLNPNLTLDNIYTLKDLYNYGSASVSNIVTYTKPGYSFSISDDDVYSCKAINIKLSDLLFDVRCKKYSEESSGEVHNYFRIDVYTKSTINFNNPIFIKNKNDVPNKGYGLGEDNIILDFTFVKTGQYTVKNVESINKAIVPAKTLITTVLLELTDSELEDTGDNMSSVEMYVSSKQELNIMVYPEDVSIEKLDGCIPLTFEIPVVEYPGQSVAQQLNFGTVYVAGPNITSPDIHYYDPDFSFSVKYTNAQSFQIIDCAGNSNIIVNIDQNERGSSISIKDYIENNISKFKKSVLDKVIYTFQFKPNSTTLNDTMVLYLYTLNKNYSLFESNETMADLTERVTNVKYALVSKLNVSTNVPLVYKALITTQNKVDNYYCTWEYSSDNGVSWNVCQDFIDAHPYDLVDVPVLENTKSNETLESADNYTKIVKCVPFNNTTYTNKDLLISRPDVLCVMNPNYSYKYRFTIYNYTFGTDTPSKYSDLQYTTTFKFKLGSYHIMSESNVISFSTTSNISCKLGYSFDLTSNISLQDCKTTIVANETLGRLNFSITPTNYIDVNNLTHAVKFKIIFFEDGVLLTNLTLNCVYNYTKHPQMYRFYSGSGPIKYTELQPYETLRDLKTPVSEFTQLIFNTTSEEATLQHNDVSYNTLSDISLTTPHKACVSGKKYVFTYKSVFNIYNPSNIPQVVHVHQMEYYNGHGQSNLTGVTKMTYALNIPNAFLNINIDSSTYDYVGDGVFVVPAFTSVSGYIDFRLEGVFPSTDPLTLYNKLYPSAGKTSAPTFVLSDWLKVLFIQTTFTTLDGTYNVKTADIFLKILQNGDHYGGQIYTVYAQNYNTNTIIADSTYNNTVDGKTIKVYNCGTFTTDISYRTKAITISSKETLPITTTQNESELLISKHIDVTKGVSLYYNNQIITYLVPKYENYVYVGDADSYIIPMYNTIDLAYGSKVTCVIPWRSYLIIFTESEIYLAMYDSETGTYNTKLLNTSVGLPMFDRHTPTAMLNSIIFKSGNKVYKLTPNLYSTSDSILNLHCISDTVKEYMPTSPAFNRCFAFSTNDEYFLFGSDSKNTQVLIYSYDKNVWTLQVFTESLNDYSLLSPTDVKVYSSKKEFYFNKCLEELAPKAIEHNLPYGDYLQTDPSILNSISAQTVVEDGHCLPIPFKIDFGQKSSNYADAKQFLATRIILETLHSKDTFNFTVDVSTDGTSRPVHIDVSTDSAIWKTSEQQVGTLNTMFESNNTEITGTLRQLMLKYSGRGRTINHIIKGKSKFNFKLYSLDYKFRNLPNK